MGLMCSCEQVHSGLKTAIDKAEYSTCEVAALRNPELGLLLSNSQAVSVVGAIQKDLCIL